MLPTKQMPMMMMLVPAFFGAFLPLAAQAHGDEEACHEPASFPWVKSASLFYGFTVPGGELRDNIGFEVRLGYKWGQWRFGGDTAFGVGYSGRGDVIYTAFLSATYDFIPDKWSPYVGVGVGFAAISPGYQIHAGFAGDPRLGVLLLKDRNVSMYLEGACTLPAFKGENRFSDNYTPWCRVSAGVLW